MSEAKQPETLRAAPAATELDDSRSQAFARTEWMRQVHQIRKQEFAYLRSVQKREASGDAEPTLAGFQAIAPSLGSVREDTLKKIDEIEARLNLLWVSNHSKPGPSGLSSALTQPMAQTLTTAPVSVLRPSTAPGLFTQVMYDAEMPSSVLLVNTVDTQATPSTPAQSLPSVEAISKPLPVSPQKAPVHYDGTLTTAAALFANGENDLAAQHLLRAIRAIHAQGKPKAQSLPWVLGLLEIYRATGNQAQFDWSVLEYFDYWDGVTPQWRNAAKTSSGVLTLNRQVRTEPATFAASGMDQARVWRCPSVLNRGAARAWCEHWLGSRHCAIDWTSLSTIDADGAADLVVFLQSTEQGPTQLVFFDTPNLLYVLEQATPQGQAQVPRSLWELRFCLLGLMHMRAAFDAAAADFCLTYIENAPVWRPGRASFDGDVAATPAPTVAPDPATADTPWRLHGQVLGNQALGLPDQAWGREPQKITISCTTLVRMDDDAISQLLQWVRQAQMQKVDVQFADVSLLVAAAWAAAGLEAHARVTLRDQR